MHVIHFTEGATDPLQAFGSQGVRFVPLADGCGDAHVSCLHMTPGATISAPPDTDDCLLLFLHGTAVFRADHGPMLELQAGVRLVLRAAEHYTLETQSGAVVLTIECDELAAHQRGISTPERIMGQRWPGELDPSTR